jgi:succinate dehydrogenase / fumarate reductase iron-sulfur subunit
MMFRIARSRDGGSITHYDLYKVDIKKGMTVLDALFQIQDRMDPSLSFRYSCRGAVCGSCSMLINKEPRLACRTQIADVKNYDMKLKPFSTITDTPTGWNSDVEILIEPLPNMPILKDLVVDMAKFYDSLESMKLWSETEDGDTPRLQSPTERKKIERYVNCILCALCYGSCPVNAENEEYVGPAALAKAWRFHEDSRSPDPERYVKSATM